MIYFIYGKDTYGVKRQAGEILAKFVAAEGDFNVEKFSGKETALAKLAGSVQAMPFLGNRRMCVVSNLFAEGEIEEKRKIAAFLTKVPDFSDIIFTEDGEPDRREVLYKALTGQGVTVCACAEPGQPQVALIIKQQLAKKKLEITGAALSKLSFDIGTNLWQLKNELNKIENYAEYCGKQKIDEGDLALLINTPSQARIFDLTDALAVKNAKRALLSLHSLYEMGEERMKIFNLMVSHFRNMLVVADFPKNTSQVEIARAAAINPYVVRKIAEALRKFPSVELRRIYSRLSDVDYRVKTGLLDIEDGLDLLVVDFCNK